jgi:secretion/DNA translocation related CpaE-like protein
LILPAAEQSLVELISAAVEARTSSAAVIAVIGGCGGAGASTLAAGLAVTGARSGPTVLVDADCYGGGLDVLLGAEQRPGARWPELADTRGRLSAAALAEALVPVEGIAVLSWDRSGAADLGVEAAAAVMDAAIRGSRWVIVDLPRTFDAAAMALAGMADLVVLLVPAKVRAVAAAATVAAQVLRQCSHVRIVVRDGRAGHLGNAEIAAALDLPVAAGLQSESAVTAAADRGEPPLRRPRGSLHEVCEIVLELATAEAPEAAA